MALYCYQRALVTWKNIVAVWLDGGTPPSGFTLNEQVRVMISTSFARYTQSKIRNYSYNSTSVLVILPPLPGSTLPITPRVITVANSDGQLFKRRGTHQHP